MSSTASRNKERIIRLSGEDSVTRLSVGVDLRLLASAACGATSFSTSLATLLPGAFLPLHRHPVGEAITVIEGTAVLQVEGRSYRLQRLDCAFVPAGTPHAMRNPERKNDLRVHSAFASASPHRELVQMRYKIEDRAGGVATARDPEKVMRFAQAPVYELAPGAYFTDLFARRLGSVGICGGYGRFAPGAALPCHIHDFDESITIVQGAARCFAQGRQHAMRDCATAWIPEGMPHRFVNDGREEMGMIWVYAGAEPDRRLVDAGYCSGSMVWPGPFLVR